MKLLRLFCSAFGLGAALMLATSAHANERRAFALYSSDVGASTTNQCYQGLCVSLYIKRINVNGDKVEICAEFGSDDDWSGGYRLTNRDDPTTFASLSIDAGDTKERCEILPRTTRYWVVLRQD